MNIGICTDMYIPCVYIYVEILSTEWMQKKCDRIFCVGYLSSNVLRLFSVFWDGRGMLAFNCGCGNLNGSTLLKKLNAGDYEGAAQEFLKWDMAAGHHMAGLLRRRQAEELLFLKDMA